MFAKQNHLLLDSSGEWVLTASDVEWICIGTGILGSGGGGSPHVGEMMIKKLINEGNQIKVTNPFRYVAIHILQCIGHTLQVYICDLPLNHCSDWIHQSKV